MDNMLYKKEGIKHNIKDTCDKCRITSQIMPFQNKKDGKLCWLCSICYNKNKGEYIEPSQADKQLGIVNREFILK